MLKEIHVLCICRRLEEQRLAVPHDESAPVSSKVENRFDVALMGEDGLALPRQVYRECVDSKPASEGVFVANVEVDIRSSGVWQVGTVRWTPLKTVTEVFFNMVAAKPELVPAAASGG